MLNSITINVLIYGADLNRSAELSQFLTEDPAIHIVGCYDSVDQSSQYSDIHQANIILTDLIHLVDISTVIRAMSLLKSIVFTVSGAHHLVEIIKSNHFMANLILEQRVTEQLKATEQMHSQPLTKIASTTANDQQIFNNPLTEREQEVLDYLVKGCSYKMTACSMFISIDTVRSHIKKIYAKLEVNSKSEAVIKVLRAQHPN